MQLLKLVVFHVGIETRAVHSIRIVLVRDWAILACTRMPGGDYTFPHDTSVMRGRAIVMRVVGGEAPAADLPQRAVILVMIGRVLVAFEAIRERSGRPGPLTFLTREETKASLWDCLAFKTVVAVFVDPF
jgi:hypothetical protein